jgi:hypothetical protein
MERENCHKAMELRNLELGGGKVESVTSGWRLTLPAGTGYADAQLDDTANVSRDAFRWKPPLRLTLRARTTNSAPGGTFGFGFWNDPFAVSLGLGGATRRWLAMPQSAWFFYLSPPGDLRLDARAPGNGWKAATLQSASLPTALLAPLAMGGAIFFTLPFLRRLGFFWARRFYRAEEAGLVADPAEWHAYAIEWRSDGVRFQVDGHPVLHSLHPPRPPLGLVLWIDNQYAVLSPERGIGFGVLPRTHLQSLELEDLRIEALDAA